ncbi:MAG: Gfo/Idh/MocA family oxidoreductase [Pirellulaceae bacterium]|jgi:predicted dehydrogenase|nr:Gfo/Idh/MocA family oxidoreductase [Pirellulaceae bacterium]MDP7017349.1 Gfo/Idh/MocA family oxidoreductase [Pirellulaceae bacterium]
MAKYRIGVIGHTGRGNYGHGVDRGWLHVPNCQIVGVADADESGRGQAAKRLKAPRAFADYRKLLDETKPHIVSICTRWLDQHHAMALAAAERGIHIYMEKPFCRTLAEADELVKVCNKNDVKMAQAFVTRYSPTLPVIRDLIEDGAIGQLIELRGRGKEDRRGGGEDLWVLGSHILNLMHHFGGDPTWCFARVSQDGEPLQKKHVQPGAEGIGPLAGDSLSAVYGMNDGATGFFGSVRNTAGRRFGLQLLGTKGAIDLTTGYLPKANFLDDPSWSPGRSGKQWKPITSAGVGKPETVKDPSHLGGNIAACIDLVESIEEDRLPEANIFEALTSVEMIASVFESQRQGGPVPLPMQTRANPLTLIK